MSISATRVKQWRKNTKLKMITAMGGKCQCCGYDTCSSALAFHHIDPTQKDLGFGDVRATPKKWSTIIEELRKCVLVCHNCHSEIHAGIRELPKTYATFDESYANIEKIIEYNSCPQCGSKKEAHKKYCSHKCAQSSKRKVDWNNIDVLQMLKEYKISELEKMWGISNAAIYKRRDIALKML